MRSLFFTGSNEIDAKIDVVYSNSVSKDNVIIFDYDDVPVKKYENVRMEISMQEHDSDPMFVG